jgi:hypothetical protein
LNTTWNSARSAASLPVAIGRCAASEQLAANAAPHAAVDGQVLAAALIQEFELHASRHETDGAEVEADIVGVHGLAGEWHTR